MTKPCPSCLNSSSSTSTSIIKKFVTNSDIFPINKSLYFTVIGKKSYLLAGLFKFSKNNKNKIHLFFRIFSCDNVTKKIIKHITDFTLDTAFTDKPIGSIIAGLQGCDLNFIPILEILVKLRQILIPQQNSPIQYIGTSVGSTTDTCSNSQCDMGDDVCVNCW
jgi:hypothetical protein